MKKFQSSGFGILCLVLTASLSLLSCTEQELAVPLIDHAQKEKPDNEATEGCAQEETAWADGERYINPGNWATYTAYEGTEKTVALYAAENIEIGTVSFSSVADEKVTITIQFTPDSGWELQDGDETLKIQGYNSAPVGNPAPGLFKYKSNELSVEVAAYDYYGVHLDVQNTANCN